MLKSYNTKINEDAEAGKEPCVSSANNAGTKSIDSEMEFV
jgi:hypothetical protein